MDIMSALEGSRKNNRIASLLPALPPGQGKKSRLLALASRYALLPSLLLALVLAHAGGLAEAWSGRAYFGCDLERDRCDTLYTLRLAHGALLRLQEAWAGVDCPWDLPRFVVHDIWQTAVDARVLNMLDLALLLWPLRLLTDLGPALLLLHLGLLGLAMVAGWFFARALGANGLGAAAAAIVCGSSAVVMDSVSRGQYAQALLPFTLLYFAGLARMWRGRRLGLPMLVSGAVLAALSYWQNVLILGLGSVIFCLGALAASWPRNPRLARELLLGLGLAFLFCLPAAWPLLEAMRAGSEHKLIQGSWGQPFLFPTDQGWTPDCSSALAILDSISPGELFSPTSGWLLPALPLLVPAIFMAVFRRRHLPWLFLVLTGAVLVMGPLPLLSQGPGGQSWEALGGGSRVVNPVYMWVFRWVPSASRMHHAMRWGSLMTVGLAAFSALGIHQLARRIPSLALATLVSGLLWVVFLGPWPLALNPFPGQVEQSLGTCSQVLVAPRLPQRGARRTPGEFQLLQGLHQRPSYPILFDALQGFAPPTSRQREISFRRRNSLEALLSGSAPSSALPSQSCVLVDGELSTHPMSAVDARLSAQGARHEQLLLPPGTFHLQDEPRVYEIYRLP